MNINFQEAQNPPRNMNSESPTPEFVIKKLLKANGRVSRAERDKQVFIYNGSSLG
jgi:hypothetical protein